MESFAQNIESDVKLEQEIEESKLRRDYRVKGFFTRDAFHFGIIIFITILNITRPKHSIDVHNYYGL